MNDQSKARHVIVKRAIRPMLDLGKAAAHLGMDISADAFCEYLSEPKDAQNVQTAQNSTAISQPAPGDIPLTWPEDSLPATKLTSGNTNTFRSADKMERILKAPEPKPAKIARRLYYLDIWLIRQVTADDLVRYDGDTASPSIVHLLNKNKGILNWISLEPSFRSIKKMMKESLRLKSYNTLNILVKAIQSRPLTVKEIEQTAYFKGMLDTQQSGIFPFEWLLKDCADSNVNVDSPVASLRFCKIIERLKQMKTLPSPELSTTRKYFLLWKAWAHLQLKVEKQAETPKASDKLYLVL